MTSSPKYCINGRFLTRPITGVDRFAREIVRELDELMLPGEAVLLLPKGCEPIAWDPTHNIEERHFGGHRGHVWEQMDLLFYVSVNHLLPVNLCNSAPILNPGVVCIHDMAVRANPLFYGRKFRMWYRFMFRCITNRAKAIVTVSQFSKSEISKYYPDTRGDIIVVSNAWQHVARIQQDDSVLEKHGLEPGEYYFAMSSLAPNKNLKWIAETARLNSCHTFAVAGGINTKIFGSHDIPEVSNVKYLGYVSDSEAKSLMANCRAFVYPTFYEGFGIPPMEAMASGAPAIVVGDNSCMHEVYGSSVSYVDPYVASSDITSLLHEPDDRFSNLLGNYSWKKSASRLLDVIRGGLSQ